MGLFTSSKETLYKKAMDAYKEKNYEKAFKLFQKSADKDSAVATFMLGRLYKNGLYVKADENKAIELFDKAAQLGCSEGTDEANYLRSKHNIILGTTLFSEGKHKQAQELFLKAESLFSTGVGAYNLAATYENEGDYATARKWYEKSYKNGDKKALQRLILLVPEDNYDYLHWMEDAANEGDEEAMEYVVKGYLHKVEPEYIVLEDKLLSAVEEYARSRLDDKDDLFVISLQPTPYMAIVANSRTNLREVMTEEGHFYSSDYMYSILDWEPDVELDNCIHIVESIYHTAEYKHEKEVVEELLWAFEQRTLEACKNVMKKFKETDTYKAFPELYLFVDLGDYFSQSKADALFEEINGTDSIAPYMDLLDDVSKALLKELRA